MSHKCSRCGQEKTLQEMNRKCASWCKKCSKQVGKSIKMRNKMMAIHHYSETMTCACCGEHRIEFLTIDHINGDGGRHRASIGHNICDWLKKNHYPTGFRVLCFNCNCSIGAYGYCPHAGHTDFPADIPEIKPRKFWRGSFHCGSKLNEAIVVSIRQRLSIGETLSSLSREFGVSTKTIRNVRDKMAWTHV